MNRPAMLTISRNTATAPLAPDGARGRPWGSRAAAIGVLCLACTVNVGAQTGTSSSPGLTRPPAGVATPAPRQAESRPTWKELNAEQQLALKPLTSQWAGLSAERKRKWIELSKNYSAMSASEQAKLQGRMKEWVALSQQQRTQARLNYVQSQRLAPDEKGSQWQAYQALSAEEKRLLRSQAPGKPGGVATVKPATGDKIIHVPITRHSPKTEEAAAALAIHRNTLLPQPAASAPAAEIAASVAAPTAPDTSTPPASEAGSDKSLNASERASSAPTQNQ